MSGSSFDAQERLETLLAERYLLVRGYLPSRETGGVFDLSFLDGEETVYVRVEKGGAQDCRRLPSDVSIDLLADALDSIGVDGARCDLIRITPIGANKATLTHVVGVAFSGDEKM